MTVNTANPERRATLIQFVNDADGLRIQICVERCHWRMKYQAPGVSLDFVIGKPSFGRGRQNQRRLVAITCQHFNPFAVDHRAAGQVQQKRARGAIGRKHLHQLFECVARDEAVDAVGLAFQMPLAAGERTGELRQRARAWRAGGGVIAIQQEGFFLVHAHVKAPRGLRIKTARRRVAIDRIELVRANVAEHALTQILVRVVSQGQQVFALDLAFEEHRTARTGTAFAIARLVVKAANFLLETVALAHRADVLERQVVEVECAFDNAGADQGAQMRQERDRLGATQYAAADRQRGLARCCRWDQLVFTDAAVDEHLRARLKRVEILNLPQAETRLQRDTSAACDQHALGVNQTHFDGHRSGAICDA